MTAPQRTGWVGWNVFAAVMLMIGGFMSLFTGFIALVNDEWVVWGERGAVYLDLSEWAWVHLILGAILVLSGLGIMSGNVLARTVGVVIAALSMLINFLWLPAFPLWAVIVIVIDALVIWALTAHGAEMREA